MFDLNLARTAKAVVKYDAEVADAWAALDTIPNDVVTNGHVWQVVALEHRLGREVGHAFGLDTDDRNSMSTCEGCVRPDSWLRNLIDRWRAS